MEVNRQQKMLLAVYTLFVVVLIVFTPPWKVHYHGLIGDEDFHAVKEIQSVLNFTSFHPLWNPPTVEIGRNTFTGEVDRQELIVQISALTVIASFLFLLLPVGDDDDDEENGEGSGEGGDGSGESGEKSVEG